MVPMQKAWAQPATAGEGFTAEMGIFKVKNMADGIYTATLEKTGYKTVTVTVSIANGEMTVLNACGNFGEKLMSNS